MKEYGYEETVIQGLLKELDSGEEMLKGAEADLLNARARFEVASRKYAAIRDAIMKICGQSPYAWIIQQGGKVDWGVYGRYRFIQMPIGRAVVAALEEAGEPLKLDDIVNRLRGGGISKSPASLKRAVNAAVMKTKYIVKVTEPGEDKAAARYTYEPDIDFILEDMEKEDEEDLPF